MPRSERNQRVYISFSMSNFFADPDYFLFLFLCFPQVRRIRGKCRQDEERGWTLTSRRMDPDLGGFRFQIFIFSLFFFFNVLKENIFTLQYKHFLPHPPSIAYVLQIHLRLLLYLGNTKRIMKSDQWRALEINVFPLRHHSTHALLKGHKIHFDKQDDRLRAGMQAEEHARFIYQVFPNENKKVRVKPKDPIQFGESCPGVLFFSPWF